MFFLLLEKINRAANQIAAFFCNVGFLLMCAFIFLLSAWRVVLPVAGAVALIAWMWALGGGGAALLTALVCGLAGALMWLAHTFRI